MALLDRAEGMLRSGSINDAWSRLSLTELLDLISASRVEIAEGRLAPSRSAELWRVFAPTSDWDDVVGDVALGNAVFELVEALYGRPR